MNKLQNQPGSSMRPRLVRIQSFVSLVLRPVSDGIVLESCGSLEAHAKGITKSEEALSRDGTLLLTRRRPRPEPPGAEWPDQRRSRVAGN